MRPYRGKRKDGRGWAEGWYLRLHCRSDGCEYYVHIIDGGYGEDKDDRHEVIRETVGQSTGLEDKNGVEVWAGGWLRHYGINTRPMGQVKFYNGAFCAFWQGGRPERLTRNLTRHFEFFDDNPELLEAEKEN